jgi:serine/threonine-protein kinase
MLAETSYRVVCELGAGGMGVVYEIEHVRLKKRYVAKVIHDQISREEGAAKRMEREAQVLAAISHRNIVQVHDVGTTPDGLSYFVMEKLAGVDLRGAMKQSSMSHVRAIDIVADVLDALEYVHRRGIVHRDIKPENIFLSEEPHGPVTKVLDFGIVHIFDGDGRISQGRITKTGGFVGTLYYAAPEQMQGQPAAPPNDVYAAGLVLFELIAGRGPFDDDPGVGLSRCFKPAPRLADVAPRVPHELSEIVARALDQNPAGRPRAGDLASELRALNASMRSDPQVAEDEALRAEIADLLRHMPPPDLAPRPAKNASKPPPAEGLDGTVAEQPDAFDATLASTSGIASPPNAMPTLAETLPLGPPPVAAGRPPNVETAPGLYATVDRAEAPAKAKAKWWRAILGSVLLLVGSLVAVYWIVSAQHATTTASSAPPQPTEALPAASAPSASASAPVKTTGVAK